MDQPMRWVCLCLDAHNFVVGPAPRADEISRMMHRSHVQPPVPRQPASSLHAANPTSHLRFGIAGGSPETRVAASAVGPFSQPKPLIVALNAALIDRKMKARSADLGGAVPVFEPSAYCRRQSAKTGPRRGEHDDAGGDFSAAAGSRLPGVEGNRDPRATLDSSLSRCRVQRGFCSWVGTELICQMMLHRSENRCVNR